MKRDYGWSGQAVVLSLFCILVWAPIVAAGQYESLTPLLINLNGWEAESPEGMDMEMGSTKIVQAMREYKKGKKSLNVMVMVGNNPMAGQMQPRDIETDNAKVSVEKIDGFNVMQQYAKKEGEGTVVVSLSESDQKGAQFMMNFTGMRPAEALSMAKKFNWGKIQKVTAKVK